MRLNRFLALPMLASLMPILATAAPDEASGIVTNVVDDALIRQRVGELRAEGLDSGEIVAKEARPGWRGSFWGDNNETFFIECEQLKESLSTDEE